MPKSPPATIIAASTSIPGTPIEPPIMRGYTTLSSTSWMIIIIIMNHSAFHGSLRLDMSIMNAESPMLPHGPIMGMSAATQMNAAISSGYGMDSTRMPT